MRISTLVGILASSRGELYSKGDENISLTGGWIAAADPRCVSSADGVGYTSKAPTLTKNADSMTIELTGNVVSGTVRTSKRITLTDAKTITLKGTLGRGSGYTNTATHPYIVLYAQDAMGTANYYHTSAASKSELQNGITTLDVSKLSGDYYIALGFFANSSYPVKYVMESCVMS